ncbi:MAG TPA: phytanoyl-CoA dioxygenase family protein, partial [Pirellulales bacterium]|nr:phytanoyl-CoA dioxygenase family protein [Pirellulales bacterium]
MPATSASTFSPQELSQYESDGYLFVPGLFDADEMQILLDYARQDAALMAGASGRKDKSGQITKLTLWNQAGDDLYSMFSR